jgi:hypothetical protein
MVEMSSFTVSLLLTSSFLCQLLPYSTDFEGVVKGYPPDVVPEDYVIMGGDSPGSPSEIILAIFSSS